MSSISILGEAQLRATLELPEVKAAQEAASQHYVNIFELQVGVGRRLAESYLQNGLYSSALLECEQILSKQPTSPDVVALMGEIESRSGGTSVAPAPSNGKEKDANERGADGGLTAPPRKGAAKVKSDAGASKDSGQSTGLTAPNRGGEGIA